jgi:hypothetical protein
MADLSIQNEGNIYLLRALSDAGKTWIAEHIPADAQRFADAVAVEHRFIEDIVIGAANAGLEVV